MIKYKTGGFKHKIEAVTVVRETDYCVFTADINFMTGKPILDRHGKQRITKHAKRSSWENWFDSWSDAWAFLLDKAANDVELAQKRLAKAIEAHTEILTMKQESDVK